MEGARAWRVKAQLMSKTLNQNVLVHFACGELCLVYEPCLIIVLKTGGGYGTNCAKKHANN